MSKVVKASLAFSFLALAINTASAATPAKLLKSSRIECISGEKIYTDSGNSERLNSDQTLIITNGKADYLSGTPEDGGPTFTYHVNFAKSGNKLVSREIIDGKFTVNGLFTIKDGGSTVILDDYKYQTRWIARGCTVTTGGKA